MVSASQVLLYWKPIDSESLEERPMSASVERILARTELGKALPSALVPPLSSSVTVRT